MYISPDKVIGFRQNKIPWAIPPELRIKIAPGPPAIAIYGQSTERTRSIHRGDEYAMVVQFKTKQDMITEIKRLLTIAEGSDD